jgi:large subunit ribosomal protein L4
MLQAVSYDKDGNEKEKVELDSRLFGQPSDPVVIHQYIKAYLANQRQGTAKKKNRSEVRGGGAKPWRQKGTGRARAGSNTSPLWVGGGRSFAPVQRDYHMEIPKKMKRKALLSALSTLASEGRVRILEEMNLEAPRTKTIAGLFDRMGIGRMKILFLSEGKDENLSKSCRNLNNLVFKRACLVNPYDLLSCDFLVMTTRAAESLTEVFAA